MKVFALFSTLYIAASSAFSVQTSKARFGTALGGEPLFKRITGLDLFAPNPDINTYGARKNKNVRNPIKSLESTNFLVQAVMHFGLTRFLRHL